MAYDEALADRVRAVLAPREGLSEREMFGGIAFMLAGNMAVGVIGDDLLVRAVGDVQPEAALAQVELDLHREELLALRVADDRLEGPEDLDVSRRRWDSVRCRRG